MKFLLIIAISSASGLDFRVHEKLYTKEECETIATIAEAEAGAVTTVLAKCVGIPS